MSAKQPKGIRAESLTKWIFQAEEERARCGGRGYFIVLAGPDWDVTTVRIGCDGCPDCKKESKP